MHNQRWRIYVVVTLAMLAILLSSTTTAQEGTMFGKQLTGMISRIRTGETSQIRVDAAEHLADLTLGIDPLRMHDEILTEIISLLDTSEDSVRFWVAVSLGNLGPRADIAIPKFKELLPEADCVRGELTSADAIRYALAQMRIPPPPPTCGRTTATEAMFKRLLAKTIAILRTGETVTIRTGAAQNLAALTHWVDPKKVDDKDVRDLVDVLNSSAEESVRAWVVGALGNLRSRAAIAIPDLLNILAKEDCAKESPLSVSLEDDTRFALIRMGVTSPPSRCGRPLPPGN